MNDDALRQRHQMSGAIRWIMSYYTASSSLFYAACSLVPFQFVLLFFSSRVLTIRKLYVALSSYVRTFESKTFMVNILEIMFLYLFPAACQISSGTLVKKFG